MRKEGEWADHIIIAATVYLLGINLVLISESGLDTTLSAPEISEDAPVLHLGYIANNHFFALDGRKIFLYNNELKRSNF